MARPVSIQIVVGQRFGKLTVESFSGSVRGQRKWHCRCDCGQMTTATSGNLSRGHTVSCGCRKAEFNREVRTTHGMSNHPLYAVWNQMLTRCENPRAEKFKDYGARGIRVCEAWRDSATFMSWALANGWERGLQIDRRDNDGNYEPSNCHFVTRKNNMLNRRSTIMVTALGETKTLKEWSDDPRCGIGYLKLWTLVRRKGLPLEAVMSRG